MRIGKESLRNRLNVFFFFQPINTVIERDEEKMKIQSAINVGMENNGENLQVGMCQLQWQIDGKFYGKFNGQFKADLMTIYLKKKLL